MIYYEQIEKAAKKPLRYNYLESLMKRPNMKSSDIHRMQQLVTLFKKYTLNDPSNPNNRKTNQSIGDSDGTDW